VNNARLNNHLEVVKWAIENGCPDQKELDQSQDIILDDTNEF